MTKIEETDGPKQKVHEPQHSNVSIYSYSDKKSYELWLQIFKYLVGSRAMERQKLNLHYIDMKALHTCNTNYIFMILEKIILKLFSFTFLSKTFLWSCPGPGVYVNKFQSMLVTIRRC